MKLANKLTLAIVGLTAVVGIANWENIIKCGALIIGGTMLAQDASAQIDQVNGMIVTPVSTSYGGFTNMVVGQVSLPAPQVSGSLVQADGNGNINYTNNASVDQNGNFMAVSVNAVNNVSAGGTMTAAAILLPVATAGVTPTLGDLVKTSAGTVCIKINNKYYNLATSAVQTTLASLGSLLGTGTATAIPCVF